MELIVPGQGSGAGVLERPWNRRSIIVDLATTAKTQEQIGREYGVTQQAISDFAKRHRDEIQAIRDNGMDTMTGIALAKKEARLDTYREILEKCLEPTPKMAGKEYVVDPETGRPVLEIDAAVAVKVLRNIAEELGHLPSRVVEVKTDTVTNYTINGVDPNNLK